MIKSTLIKWTVAAAMALPAVPMFGKTIHRRLVRRTHSHIVLAATAPKTKKLSTAAHRLTTRSHRKVTLTSRHKLSSLHRLTSLHRTARKTTATRHAKIRTASSSSSHFKVHVTKMPPTIDGLNT